MLFIGAIVWYTTMRQAVSDGNAAVPAAQDADRDLVSDEEESRRGTNPQLADTDNDGLEDGTEIKLQTDPKNPHSISPEFLDGEAMMQRELELMKQKRNQK